MRKTYQIPSVEMALLMPSTIILAGSPGITYGGGTDEFGGGAPIGD
jgi:hypothetical protein